MTRILDPKPSEIDRFFRMCMKIRAVYLGNEIFIRQKFYFFPDQFLGEVLSPRIGDNSEKMWFTSMVARVEHGDGEADDPGKQSNPMMQ